mmetsp:Transcript_143355/g.458175  ORF Transcript_143355/g.458175 Transcript_143355/m.458175 type:complete len:207 (-) Transcript_143355:324-944(-)
MAATPHLGVRGLGSRSHLLLPSAAAERAIMRVYSGLLFRAGPWCHRGATTARSSRSRAAHRPPWPASPRLSCAPSASSSRPALWPKNRSVFEISRRPGPPPAASVWPARCRRGVGRARAPPPRGRAGVPRTPRGNRTLRVSNWTRGGLRDVGAELVALELRHLAAALEFRAILARTCESALRLCQFRQQSVGLCPQLLHQSVRDLG